ncbi:MAG: DUF2130 domain-containing protein [Sphingobacteriales bacterium]|nr:DUF2130 domain-containing protein [Sphingobacteriales bacterium]
MSDNKIKCPNCGTLIDIDEVLNHQAEEKYKKEFEEKYRNSASEFQKAKEALALQLREFEEKKAKENELFQKRLEQKLEEEKIKITQEQQSKLKEEYALSLQKLEEENSARKEENQALKNQRLELLKKEEALEEDKKNFELKLLEQRKAVKEELESKIKQEKDSEIDLLKKEFKIREEQQAKLIDEMKRKAEQGSMQLQGEKQELVIEEFLKDNFPFDEISEVAKGKRGADCIQIINTRNKSHCGSIIYESKETANWDNKWIEKLKQDKITANADIAVLVTTKYPKNIDRMTLIEDVWVCSLPEFKSLCFVLRDSLIKIDAATTSQMNKGDKMVMLYDYFTGADFKDKWTAIRESFIAMRMSIIKEREQMEKLWSAREKNLDKIIRNASNIQGDIEGISGLENVDINLLDE